MKRKVVQQGPATLMVSIPSKWVKKYRIKKGRELDFVENGKNLMIQLEEPKKAFKRINFKLKSSHQKYVLATIRNLYINGYDQINLDFNSEDDIVFVTDIVNSLIGYEILDQNSMSCSIKDIANENIDDYKIIFRKVWLTIKLMIEVVLDSLSGKQNELSQKKIKDLKDNAYKFTSYCRRLLFKHNKTNSEKGLADYIIMMLILMIAHNIYYIHEYLHKNQFKIKKETIKFAEDIQKLFDVLYKSYYNPKSDFGSVARDESDNKVKIAYDFFTKDSTKNSVIFYRLAEISRLIGTTIAKLETVTSYEKVKDDFLTDQ